MHDFHRHWVLGLALTLLIPTMAACGGDSTGGPAESGGGQKATADDPTDSDAGIGLLSEELPQLLEPWTGDFQAMVERRVIRALVVSAKPFYFFDGAKQRGISYDALTHFEKQINEELGSGHQKVQLFIVPVSREQLIPALAKGVGDLAAGNLTITPERLELVDFSDPAMKDVSEVLVTGPEVGRIASFDELGDREIWVRQSSSYFGSLAELNRQRQAAGDRPLDVRQADDFLEDQDILEMVNSDLLPATIVDLHKARFWGEIFEDVTVHEDLTVRTGGQIGWAFRKDSPEFAAVVNRFIAKNKVGTLFGNMMLNRYLKDTKYVRNATDEGELEKFHQLVGLFRQYADQYDFDHLMVMAQAYQESGLDHTKRSGAGAIGVMQLLKSTAADPNVGIPDIEELESNIHAGVKYLHFIQNRYFQEEAISEFDRTLFSFAAYNAGPARVAKLRREAEESGLDPNVWFDNVETIAARRIGRETVQYVSNISKYYVAYRRVAAESARREAARSPA